MLFFHKLTCMHKPPASFFSRYDFTVTAQEVEKLLADFDGDLTLPENFEMTVTPYDGKSNKKNGKQPICQVGVVRIYNKHL